MSERPSPCPLCGGLARAPEVRAETGEQLWRCAGCRLVFLDPRDAPPAATLYPAFEQRDAPALRAVRTALSVFTRQRARVVERARRSGRLLDYGAGNGAFARLMAGRGFEVVGLEPYSLGRPAREPGLTLLRAPLAEVRGELGTFDVVTLWHVLEHVETPVALLAELRALLRPGGVVVVSVPNYASWQRRVFGGGWFHLDPPRHLLQFEPATLDDCLARAGLRVVHRAPFLPEYGTSGWIQSALNRVLPHRNFLFEWTKDRGALEAVPATTRAALLAASAAGAAPAFLAALPIELAASLLDRAAALTVVAERSP